MILATVNDSCFSIGGVPYRKNHLFPLFYSATGKIEFRREIAPGQTLIDPTHYSDYVDASTGNPFASYQAVVNWIEANCFLQPLGGGSGATTLAFMQTLFVVPVPAADDEVAPGAAIVHEFLDAGTLQVVEVNGITWYSSDFTHTAGVGAGQVELTTPAREFQAGDVVLLLKNP